MKGYGTSTDPYIITTAEELYSMEEAGSPLTCFALGCDIDLNGTPAAENFLPVVLNCRRLDGRGFRIRNILSTAAEGELCIIRIPSGVETAELRALTVENAHLTAPAVSIFSGSSGVSLRIQDCSFSVKGCCTGAPPAEYSFFGVSVAAERCSFILDIRWRVQHRIIGSGSLSRCQFRLDIRADSMFPGTVGAYPLFDGLTAADTYFMGNISCYDPYRFYCVMFNTVTLSNCYAVITAEGEAYIIDTLNTQAPSPCFYDSDTGGTGYFALSHFLGLSTAQCRDAAYLRSVGFDCGGGE